jgi:diguanylate cyclase (GGDEF)-like protein
MIQAMLEKHNHAQSYLNQLELICVAQLSDGILRLAEGGVNIVLLDLSLPDTDGLETLLKLREYEQDVPVVVLTAHDDESLAVEAMQSGAQDYLVKGQINKEMLVRSLRYALERHQLTRQLSFIDELTGLYNRRGFMTLAEQHLKIARRTQRDCLLVYADMDGLKQINDAFGHQEGSKSLRNVAEVLSNVFRESDLIGRIGGDEYTILMLDAPYEIGELITARLQEHLDVYNRGSETPYELALSIGIVRLEHGTMDTLEELLVAADKAMYENKRSKRFTGIVSEVLEVIKEPLGAAV